MLTQDTNNSLLDRKFVGTVVAIVPPNTTINGYTHKTWKLQVRISALHQNIADSQLPFFTISRQLFRGASANVGNYSIPRVGSKVEVRFDAGSSESGYVCSELLDGSVLTTNEYLPNSSGQNQDNYGWIDEHGNYNAVISNGSNISNYVNQWTMNVTGAYTINAANTYIINAQNSIQINGESTILVHGNGTVTIESDATVVIQRGGKKITVSSSNVTIDGDTIINGNLTVNGSISFTGNGTGNGSLTITGNVTGGGVSLNSHIHGGVQGGSGTTTPPV